MSNRIRKLIKEGEGQCLDFKFCITDSRKIARTLVAFANTDGGILLIGVKDNGAISGVHSEEEFYMIQAAAQMYCRPVVHFEAENWKIGGRTVMEVKVPKSNSGPYYTLTDGGKWRVYIRSGDQNFLANQVLLKSWKARRTRSGTLIRYTRIEKILLEHLSNNGEITLSKFRKLAKIPRFLAEKILVNFIVLNIINIKFTEKGIFYYLPDPEKKIFEDPL